MSIKSQVTKLKIPHCLKNTPSFYFSLHTEEQVIRFAEEGKRKEEEGGRRTPLNPSFLKGKTSDKNRFGGGLFSKGEAIKGFTDTPAAYCVHNEVNWDD
jgi:hypothetical protein